VDPVEAAPAAGPEPGRRRQVAAAAVLLAVAGICLFLANRALVTAAEYASDPLVRPAEATYRQFECIERAITERVPAGARVFVDEEDDLWDQRLVELASPRLQVVDTAGESTVVLSVEPDPSGPSCSGTALVVAPA
jgi:hypothetical protein